ncbi:MAG: VOC family protein [Cyanobacteria bacterium P01_D01_bin.56]
MPNYKTIETKSFVPSRDFKLSKEFYVDIGFELKWSDSDLAYFASGNSSFLLQNFYVKEHADNFMMHLLVESADDWWQRIKDNKIDEKYDIKLGEPEDREWGLRDFTLMDPTGVLWRIGNNIDKEVI